MIIRDISGWIYLNNWRIQVNIFCTSISHTSATDKLCNFYLIYFDVSIKVTQASDNNHQSQHSISDRPSGITYTTPVSKLSTWHKDNQDVSITSLPGMISPDFLHPRCPCPGHKNLSHRSSCGRWQTNRQPSSEFCHQTHISLLLLNSKDLRDITDTLCEATCTCQ